MNCNKREENIHFVAKDLTSNGAGAQGSNVRLSNDSSMKCDICQRNENRLSVST